MAIRTRSHSPLDRHLQTSTQPQTGAWHCYCEGSCHRMAKQQCFHQLFSQARTTQSLGVLFCMGVGTECRERTLFLQHLTKDQLLAFQIFRCIAEVRAPTLPWWSFPPRSCLQSSPPSHLLSQPPNLQILPDHFNFETFKSYLISTLKPWIKK